MTINKANERQKKTTHSCYLRIANKTFPLTYNIKKNRRKCTGKKQQTNKRKVSKFSIFTLDILFRGLAGGNRSENIVEKGEHLL